MKLSECNEFVSWNVTIFYVEILNKNKNFTSFEVKIHSTILCHILKFIYSLKIFFTSFIINNGVSLHVWLNEG